jgi:2-oxoglutarate ferredoxin oxidoreductase subunit gamma
MKTEIVLSGVGGQGLISTAEIIGLAASIYEDGLYASMTASYGSEARGTFTKTDVIVSDGQIGYPSIDAPDVILCLAQIAYDKYINKFVDKTKVFYDSDLVKKSEIAKGEHIGYPFRAISIGLGSIQSANTIALGVIMHKIGLISQHNLEKAIEDKFAGKDKIVSVNKLALEKGFSL